MSTKYTNDMVKRFKNNGFDTPPLDQTELILCESLKLTQDECYNVAITVLNGSTFEQALTDYFPIFEREVL